MFRRIKEYLIEKKNYKNALKIANYQIAIKTQELMELEVENKKLEKEVLEQTNAMYHTLDIDTTNALIKMLSERMSEISVPE